MCGHEFEAEIVKKNFDKNLIKKVIVFFASDLAGKISIPILYYPLSSYEKRDKGRSMVPLKEFIYAQRLQGSKCVGKCIPNIILKPIRRN